MKRYANPYLIGFFIGLLLTVTYYFTGRGIGTSSSFSRLAAFKLTILAPGHVKDLEYFKGYLGKGPLSDFVVLFSLGVVLGSAFSAFTGKRLRGEVSKGPNIDLKGRLLWALAGGMVSGFASRLGRGCITGQALTGSAELALGSWIFMFCVFIGGYGCAYFFRKEWL